MLFLQVSNQFQQQVGLSIPPFAGAALRCSDIAGVFLASRFCGEISCAVFQLCFVVTAAFAGSVQKQHQRKLFITRLSGCGGRQQLVLQFSIVAAAECVRLEQNWFLGQCGGTVQQAGKKTDGSAETKHNSESEEGAGNEQARGIVAAGTVRCK